MNKVARQQGYGTWAAKENASAFWRDRRENALENTGLDGQPAKPKTFSHPKHENALELARAVCVLANAGVVTDDIFNRSARRTDQHVKRVADAYNLLLGADWEPEKLTLDQIGLLYSERTGDHLSPEEIQRLAASITSDRGITNDQAVGFVAAVLECGRLAQSLASLIAAGTCRLERHISIATINVTGNMEFIDPRPLGPYQDALYEALHHRRIDARRLARCSNEKCLAFFYKPRLSSHACSLKCESALLARAHYSRQLRARELRAQGKSLFEIARMLGVKPQAVRKYLSAKEK